MSRESYGLERNKLLQRTLKSPSDSETIYRKKKVRLKKMIELS